MYYIISGSPTLSNDKQDIVMNSTFKSTYPIRFDGDGGLKPNSLI